MRCTSCEARLPTDARFCPSCGSPRAPASQMTEERKVVTVIFCDLVGSTELSGRLDPETMRSITLRYFDLMRQQIEPHGGTIEKFIGDAVMAVFGVPVMHEDDARRALAAALDMLDALADLNDGLTRDFNISLDVRIGVNTGEVVAATDVSMRQALVSGEVVNVAARLQQSASAGEVLVGPETLVAAGAAILSEEAGALLLKGKTDPVAAHRLLGMRPDEPELSRRFDTPFVGREAELAMLRLILERVAGQGCRLVALYGDAGIGKTRLLREWLAGTPAGTVLAGIGRCRTYGDTGTLTPVAEALRQLLDATDGSQEPGTGRALEVLRGGLLKDGTPTPSLEDTCKAVGDVLASLATEHPVVLAIDDCHWARPDLLDLLCRLVADLDGSRVLVICAGRPELLDLMPEWAGAYATAISVPPLTAAESAVLAAGLVEVSAHGAGAPARIVDRAEGNPLHLEQLLATLAEGGEPDRLPLTVHALLAARIDALSPPERTMLGLAAVVGREFDVGQVCELAGTVNRAGDGPRGEPELRHALRGLVRRRMVEPFRGPRHGAASYRFTSGLIQEVAYNGMSVKGRAECHEHLADLLAARGSGSHAGVIGGHLERAYQCRTRLGLLGGHTERLRRRATALLQSAGSGALSSCDLFWAEDLLRRAVELSPRGEGGWATAAQRLAEVRLALGDLAEGRRLMKDVLAAATAAGDHVAAAHARLHLAPLDPGLGLGTPAEVAREAFRVFESEGDDLGLARARVRIAQEQQFNGRHRAAERLLTSALRDAMRAGAEQERAMALGAIGVSLWLGPTPAAAAVARCRDLLGAHGADRRTVRATLNCPLAVLLALQGRFEEATACLAVAAPLARELGYAEAAAFIPIFTAAVESLAGRQERAEDLLREAVAACQRSGDAGMLGGASRDLARVLLDRGDEREALVHAERSAGILPPADAAGLSGLRARMAALRGEPDTAMALAGQAVAEAMRTDSPIVQAVAELDRSRALLLLERFEAAERSAVRAGLRFAEKGHLLGVGWSAALRGEAAAHRHTERTRNT